VTQAANAYSVGRRLSILLALQAFVGLALVSLVVYGAIDAHLASRQSDALQRKQEAVAHLMTEAIQDGDNEGLRHRLDDFLAGHGDLGLVILDAQGQAVYRYPSAAFDGKKQVSIEFSLDKKPAGQTAKVDLPLGTPMSARLWLDTQADDTLLTRLGTALAAAALLGTLAVSAGGYALVRHGLRPVHQLTEQTSRLAADALGPGLDGSAQPRELQPLVAQFNALLSRLAKVYEQLEGFNADVAHELNTPLSTLIASTELSLRRQRDPAALREVLGSNLEELQRLSAIVKDMLFLSRADRGSRARRSRVPSLAAVVSEVAEYHEASTQSAGLKVAVTGDAAGAFDVPLVKRAVSNLLGNATRFALAESTVRIEITAEDNDQVCLAVVNAGPPIASEHLPRLFDRFYRADAARSHADIHHGLGLAIVAAVARMHGGQAWARCDLGLTHIGLRLPLRQTDAEPTPGDLAA
jgi:two-component system heavy metal sensor histidine kinase CusS